MARSKYPRFSAPLALAKAMAAATAERQKRMDAAIAEWAIDTATGWSADPVAGTFGFTLPDGELAGEAALVGAFSKIAKTWTWGWSLEELPEAGRELSGRVRELGYGILEQPVIAVTQPQADGLASLAFVQGDGTLLYRAFGPAADTYFSVSGLRRA